MRCSCCVLHYATNPGGRLGKRTPWGSWSPRTPRTPRVECALGARLPHEFVRMIVWLDSSKGHLIRNRKTGSGWISYSRMGAFLSKISTYITSPEFTLFRCISACVSCCSFSYQVSVFNCIYLWIVDTVPCTYLMSYMFRFDPTASILQVLQLPPAKVICSISHSTGHLWMNAFTDAPSTWECRKVFPRENTLHTASTHLFRDCVLRIVPYT